MYDDVFRYGFSGIGYLGVGAIIMMVVMLILALGLYVLKGLALMQMAKDCQVKNPWLAFLPIADVYILGKILVTLDADVGFKTKSLNGVDMSFNVKLGNPALVFVIVNILMIFAHKIPTIGGFVQAFCVFFFFVVLYELYKKLVDKNAIVFALLSVIAVPTLPVLLFIHRKKFKNGVTVAKNITEEA